MKCKKELDERQLLQRGNVFQHGILLFFVLVLANAFLKEEGVVWAEGMHENLLIAWAVIALCLGEFAIRDIYPMGGGMSVLYIVEGAAGLLLCGLCTFHGVTGREPLLAGHTLTRNGAQLIQGAIMVALLLVFVGKKLYNYKRGDEDEA